MAGHQGELKRAAALFKARVAAPAHLPRLWLLSDPERLPDPRTVVDRLPAGAGVIYRHFAAPERFVIAHELAQACRRRRLILLIGADPELARLVRADGVHWPARLAHRARPMPSWIVTAAAHGFADLARYIRADAVLLSPVLPTRSASARPVLGLRRASAMARAASAPVIALGGVGPRHAPALANAGFAGLAGVDWIGNL